MWGLGYGLVTIIFRVIDWDIINTDHHQQMNPARHRAGFLISDTMCYIITICRRGRRYQCLGHDTSELTAKEEAFAQAYVLGGCSDATAAWRIAHPLSKAKPETQYNKASQMLKKGEVKDRIIQLQEVKMEKAEKDFKIDAGYVLRRFKEIDDLDILDIMEDDLSAFKPISEWPKSWRTSISGIDVKKIIQGKDEPVEMIIEKIKWPDKLKNLELLGKHINVNAFAKEEDKGAADSIADSLAKLIENLPS